MEITLEQVERLREKADVSYGQAKAALEYSGGNLLDALIYLEEQGVIPRPEDAYYSTKNETPTPPPQELPVLQVKPESKQKKHKRRGVRHLLRWLRRILLDNELEIWRKGQPITAVPMLILLILVFCLPWIALPLLILGLFVAFEFFAFRIALRCPDRFGALLAGGIACMMGGFPNQNLMFDKPEQIKDRVKEILDIMMPEMDGMAVCKHIREKNAGVGIILLTAKAQEIDKISGLMSGADDYVTKPFSPSELMARVDAVYRRVSLLKEREAQKADDKIITLGDFSLHTQERLLFKNGKPIELTQIEYQILEYLFRNPNTVLERASILNKVWGHDYFVDDKVIDVNMHRLRGKIEDEPAQPKHLVTIWGMGYKWIV